MSVRFRPEETKQAILYVLSQMGNRCDIHKLNKILYFADREHLSKYGRLITGDEYIAMKYGPVASAIYDKMKQLRRDGHDDSIKMEDRQTIQAIGKFEADWLSESEIECLDTAIKKCKSLDFNELTALSHGYAWEHSRWDCTIDYRDMLIEAGDAGEYINYAVSNILTQ